jgi:hypothetical protein
MRREPKAARLFSEELSLVASEERFAFYGALGTVLAGWSSADLDRISQGMEFLPRHPLPSIFACMVAEVCLSIGKVENAVVALEKALLAVQISGLHFWEPEVYRLRGIAAASAAEPVGKVREWLDQSIVLAHKQGARSLELRAATSACKLSEKSSGSVDWDRLAGLYRSLQDGNESADLQEAAKLLATS